MKRLENWVLAGAILAGIFSPAHAQTKVEFTRAFAPSEGMVVDPEKPLRDERCLNGSWKFQPIPVPRDYKKGTGTPPDLAQPAADKWEATPIKIPSPWNVNTWGNGRNAGEGTKRPFVADSVYYPSYPASWDGVEMGWLKRSFKVPAGWTGRRIVLHFEAVAGEAQVFVNGKSAGTHFDSFLPFDFDVTDLVKGDDNELLVGVRKSNLFNILTPGYPVGQQRTYPDGSNTDNLVGIWNDVFLWALPAVRVDDVFVQPMVDKDTLLAEVTLRNDTTQPQSVQIGGDVSPWENLAGTDVLSAPEPKWKLDAPVLNFPPQTATVPAGATTKVTLQIPVSGKLKVWSPDAPNLYGMVVTLNGADTKTVDRKYTRFGWRQFHIDGGKLLLNGQPIQLFGDFAHPFGPFVESRRYVWQDYKMIKDFGGNAVRPHANILPRLWTDLADEMGLCVLDESAIFGSSIALNLKEPVTWQRLATHVDGLVLRDRNHPSIFGWSPGNEMFALFFKTDPADKAAEYAQLKELAMRPRALDPTRDWISVDGDQDLEGTLPTWSRHMGLGLPKDLPDVGKPRMIGEHGGTYYAGPPLMAQFNGDRAFESYAGRDEALAIDLYRMVTQVARPQLTSFSASELVWFGLEQLPFGYTTDERPPNLTDGVFFPNYVENTPGVQIERLPPYVATLNPGFDPSLPPYKPLAMFDAMKAALDPKGPQPSPWDHLPTITKRTQPAATNAIVKVGFIGDPKGTLAQSLTALGVPLAAPSSDIKLLVIDGETVSEADAAMAKPLADAVVAEGGLVWIMARDKGAALSRLTALLPTQVTLTDRHATSLIRGVANPAIDGFNLADLYFAKETGDSQIAKAGLAGPLVDSGHVLLTASNTEWTFFEHQPETSKCGALLISEHVKKPSGATLVEVPDGSGKLWISTLDPTPATPPFKTFWTQLWTNLGVKLDSTTPQAQEAKKEHDLLLDGPTQ